MLPLAGLRIVVTRAAHQAEELAQPLRECGATAILLPMIGIAPPENPVPLAKAIAEIDSYDWIVFTSVNGIRALGKQKCGARIATVGAATRESAERLGWTVSVTPETYVAEALVEALGAEELNGRRILIPSAAVTRDVVRDELTNRGAIVQVVEAYRNVIPADAAEKAKEVFRVPFPDWITFASSSAAENLASLTTVQTLRHSKVASIGPVTSGTVREHGLLVTVEAKTHNVRGLVDAIVHAVAPKTA
jgi:uroporphyrinogen III methyltransferase/synthase